MRLLSDLAGNVVAMGEVKLILWGVAQPAGSKDSSAIYRKGPDGQSVPVMKDGRVVTRVRDANKKAGPWKESVVSQAREQYDGPILRGAVQVTMTFYAQRPKGHFGTGRNAGLVKDSAPVAPTVRPDGLKLARAVEDALTGIVWADDAQSVDLLISKRYAGLDERVRVEVTVIEPEVQKVGDLVARGMTEPSKPEFEQLRLVAA
jgi:Holliday junction resolvase RusA-like endonuclease